MGKLTITTQVSGNITDVYRAVAAFDPSTLSLTDKASAKYGELLRSIDNVYVFRDDKQHELEWRVSFEPPNRRSMEAINPKWADRTDVLQEEAGSTRWTITWHTRARGMIGLLQRFVFETSGKKRVLRDIVQPVLAEFPGKAGKR
ncbi:MAG: hypothetical protein EXR67_05345 [Dehalococcoidia bacterium]|nr:hypothetical protein [Dehalococcoidia bacterium]